MYSQAGVQSEKKKNAEEIRDKFVRKCGKIIDEALQRYRSQTGFAEGRQTDCSPFSTV